jgi:hypothetical protein
MSQKLVVLPDTDALGDLIKQACDHANQFRSAASSDPWWYTAAVFLRAALERE